MSSGMGTTLARQILDLTLGALAYTPPNNVYMALYLVAPNADGSGGAEVSQTGYNRVAVANTLTEWPLADGSGKTNANSILFDGAPVSWGTVVACAILSSPSTTVPMYYGTLDVARPVTPGDTPQFAPGMLRIRLT